MCKIINDSKATNVNLLPTMLLESMKHQPFGLLVEQTKEMGIIQK